MTDAYDLGLTDEEGDVFMKAIREARRGPDVPDPMAELRDEVERLRDESDAGAAALRDSGDYDDFPTVRHREGRASAYSTILDLIDKQREGQ